MEKLTFDLGKKAFEINDRGEILRFNPSDLALYNRFREVAQGLAEMSDRADAAEKDAKENPQEREARLMELLCQMDREIKDKLRYVFGEENDFDRIFEGVSVLAMAGGERVLTRFMEAVTPIIEAGAASHKTARAGDLAEQAKQNRAQRRAGRQ